MSNSPQQFNGGEYVDKARDAARAGQILAHHVRRTGEIVAEAVKVLDALAQVSESRPDAHLRLIVEAAAWGEGGGWLLDGVPDLLGARDEPEAFVPAAEHPVLVDAWRARHHTP